MKTAGRKLDLKAGRVELSHGAGGRAMAKLVGDLFHAAFANEELLKDNDQATLAVPAGRIVVSTDGYVVTPLFFPGGNIGELAVNGTVNDVAMSGAAPLWLSAAFVIEEGLALADLKTIVDSMAAAAKQAGVTIVTGDTKVVERGKADGVFITTTGVGVLADGLALSADRARPGDVVLLSGTIGDHGVAVMSKRENLSFETAVLSDTMALNGLVSAMIATGSDAIRVMRDPTRGGLAATLNELAGKSGVGVRLDEAAIPVRPEVAAACELLGLDPLYVANEGKLIAIVAPEAAEAVLAAMRNHPAGRDAAMIGAIVADDHAFVEMTTAFGGRRMVDWLAGDQLPRIC